MTVRRMLFLASSGVLVASAIFFSWALEPNESVDIDLSRDICVNFNVERLPDPELKGQLRPNVTIEQARWGEDERKYWAKLQKLIAENNSIHSAPKYLFVTGVSFQMNLVPYRGMASFVICRNDDISICRNRNFWFFKRISPLQLAQLVFENSLRNRIDLRECPF